MRLLQTPLAQRARRSRALRPVGIASYRALDRLTPARPGPRVVVNSMPKSGTHLMAEVLDQLEGMRFCGRLVMYTPADQARASTSPTRELELRTRRLRPSHYLMAHLVHEEGIQRVLEEHGAKMVTILRDPRAVVLSAKNYLYNATWMPHRDELMARLPDERAVLEFIIRGHGDPTDPFHAPDIGQHYRAYARWHDVGFGLTVRFEDLVGPYGGGSAEAQLATVGGILRHLDSTADQATVARVAAGAFSTDSITFHGGSVDAWRTKLPADLAEEVTELCADDMARLGYR